MPCTVRFARSWGYGLTAVSLIAVLENRFVLNGEAGHEIDFVFSGDLADASRNEQPALPIRDVPGLQAVWWWSPATHRSRLVPEGVADLVAQA